MPNTTLLNLTWNKRWLFLPLLKVASDPSVLELVQRAHFGWFERNHDPVTGLVSDRNRKTHPASIAATGFALSAYPVACQRGWISRTEASAYVLKTLSALWNAPQGPEVSGTSGNWGMFYHFLDPQTALRSSPPKYWFSELSTIDTALLMVGALFAANYFTGDNAVEKSIRQTADSLYKRVEWDKMLSNKNLIYHAWTPEIGMWEHTYGHYSEAMLLYLLALGSPTHNIPADAWKAYIGHSETTSKLGQTYIGMTGMPLFCFQFPHCWVDFRGIADDVNRRIGFDYFENAKRVTEVHHRYAVENPNNFRGYCELDWGLTASDGPEDVTKTIADGRQITFREYSERGCPDSFDDGTIAPTAALSSIVYTPELVIPTIRHWLKNRPELFDPDQGFTDAFNPTYAPEKPSGWVDSDRLGIDQGPVVLMIENFRSELLWRLMRQDSYIKTGLLRAGFTGGWLNDGVRSDSARGGKASESVRGGTK